MASGDTLCRFTALNGEPPASNFATPDTRNVISVLDFDDTVDESIEFGDVMPRHYSGGGITVRIGVMMTSATTGTLSVDVAFKSVTDDVDDLDTKAFAAANNANPTVASAAGEVKYFNITFTDGADMDSVLAGEYFRMLLTRDANSTTSTDNATGDMELVSVEIFET